MKKRSLHQADQGISYHLSQCCNPQVGDAIVGYFREDGVFSVHKVGCPSLRSVHQGRLVEVTWQEIEDHRGEEPIDELFYELEEEDFSILGHLQAYGLDYAHPISQNTGIGLQETFRRLRRLRELGLISRVARRMVQYRKGIVEGKWIKHRNHTYYDLTPRGERMLVFREDRGERC